MMMLLAAEKRLSFAWRNCHSNSGSQAPAPGEVEQPVVWTQGNSALPT